MRVISLPDGSRGVDCNRTVSPADAVAFKAKRFTFAMRYVRRVDRHEYDITAKEMGGILDAGLGLGLVQHVANPGWTPSYGLGIANGLTAGKEALAIGYPEHGALWLDLEGVGHGTPHAQTLAYCNAWYAAVIDAGFLAGLYVGDSCGLTPDELYRGLNFPRYWSAYTNNVDDTVSVRGYCMFQHAAKPDDLIPGFTNQTMDVNTVQTDAKGGTPPFVFA